MYWWDKQKLQIFLLNKENISDHKYERTDMVTKCKIFVTVTLHLTGI